MSGQPREVLALRHAERGARTRADSFILDDDPASPHAMDRFVWLLRQDARAIVVDTGCDAAEGGRRGRPILRDPADQLRGLGVDPGAVDTVVVTHPRQDRAGGLARVPTATPHVQAAEMAFAAGLSMCHAALRAPLTAEHVCEMVRRLYAGRVVLHEGEAEAEVAPGVSVHAVGGHSRGLPCARALTQAGRPVLASDAAHHHEHWILGKPFPIVVDVEAMLRGFRTVRGLASSRDLMIPGHDPSARRPFPLADGPPEVWRLDAGAVARLGAAGRAVA